MAFLILSRTQLKEQIFPSSLEIETQKEKRQNGRELCPSSFIEKLEKALQTKSAESLMKARNSKASMSISDLTLCSWLCFYIVKYSRLIFSLFFFVSYNLFSPFKTLSKNITTDQEEEEQFCHTWISNI